MNNEGKIKQEKWEVSFLFKHLGVKTYHKCESPDFIFDYEGKRIGLEHTNCFPNKKTIENNSWQSIENLITKELNKSDLPPRLISYSIDSHKDGKKNAKAIAEEILNGYRFMLENGFNRLDASESHGFNFNRLTYLSYFSNYTPKEFKLSEMTGGTESQNDIKPVFESVRKKENKLTEYKQLPKNKTINEYWLAVYIPVHEYCIIKNDAECFLNSAYDRIYLINGRYIGDLQKEDTSSIIRLK